MRTIVLMPVCVGFFTSIFLRITLMPSLMILPGQIRAQGFRSRSGEVGVKWYAGEGISPEVLALIQAYVDQPRYSILQFVNRRSWPEVAEEPFKSFLEDMQSRQYDLASFRFSVFLKSVGRPVKRPRLIALRPGVLQSRWARVEFERPDLCNSWHRPCSKRDSNCWMSILSGPTMSLRELELFEILGPGGYPPMQGLTDALVANGFDVRTLKMEIAMAPNTGA